jgi:glycosyltransferase involved in cell wall biosynthesis
MPGGPRSTNLVSALSRDRETAKLKRLRVAIVHDWLYGGGAELVVEQLHKLFPEAPIYTSYCSKEWRKRLDNKVVTGYLQWWPFASLRKFIPFLRILWFSNLKFKEYDLVISSSGAEAKGIKVPKGTLHINYCHAPTHYYWSRYDTYMKHPGFGPLDPLAKVGLRLLVGPLRRWDRKAAQRPDVMIANSSHIRREIKKYYKRDSTVIFPPVYMERFATSKHRTQQKRGFVISGRQTPYKRFDLAIRACNRLRLPLTVIGDGPDHRRLRAMAGPTVTFLGRVSDGVVEEEFAQAKALIFPGLDDFGITPVEAMAAGTPVVAYKAGGALDYVVPGKTGVLFSPQTVEGLTRGLQQFSDQSFNSATLQHQARNFSKENFQAAMRRFVSDQLH